MVVPVYKMTWCVLFRRHNRDLQRHQNLTVYNKLFIKSPANSTTHPPRRTTSSMHSFASYHPPILPRNHSHTQSPIHPSGIFLTVYEPKTCLQTASIKGKLRATERQLGVSNKSTVTVPLVAISCHRGEGGGDDVAAKTNRQVHRWPTVARGDVG